MIISCDRDIQCVTILKEMLVPYLTLDNSTGPGRLQCAPPLSLAAEELQTAYSCA